MLKFAHSTSEQLASAEMLDALWRIYRRPDRPVAWQSSGNLPWDDPNFSERMLREHLDESHGAASRTASEQAIQLNWLWKKLGLVPEMNICDITCGPGLYAVSLAQRGCSVTGIDFSPAAISHAKLHAAYSHVSQHCIFLQQDVRSMNPTVDLPASRFDAAILLYGQLAVFTKEEADALLAQAAQLLRPGGKLCVELLDPDRVEKQGSNWWYTDQGGLWGDGPYLHLGERFWDGANKISIERYHILHLETGELNEIHLCDQTYEPETMAGMFRQAGFDEVDIYPAWDNLPLYDGQEWVIYIGTKL